MSALPKSPIQSMLQANNVCPRWVDAAGRTEDVELVKTSRWIEPQVCAAKQAL